MIADLLALALAYCEQTLRANRRADELYHAYNILHIHEHGVAVEHLYLMLEGQVAVLSSGLLKPAEAVALLQSLRASDLYRADQNSYMLYPNRCLPNFRQKNNVPAVRAAGLELIELLAADGDSRLLVRDVAGDFHFNGRFRNAADASRTLDRLAQEPAYAQAAAAEREQILALFEETFNHRAFTGRSGTFFAYEGLGSIYWHMVSKLLLAAQESYLAAMSQGEKPAVTQALAAAYTGYSRRSGLLQAAGRIRRIPHRPLLPHTLGQRRATAGHDRAGERGDSDPLGRAGRLITRRLAAFCAHTVGGGRVPDRGG